MRDEWMTASGAELFDKINNARGRESSAYEEIRELFALQVKPIHDEQGNMVGRIGVRVHDDSVFAHHWVETSESYCGGLKASRGSFPFFGVLAGEPSGAARADVELQISLAEFERWMTEQLENLEGRDLEDDTLLSVHSLAISLGVSSEELPVAFSSTGYLNKDEFREAMRHVDELIIIEETTTALRVGADLYNLIRLPYADDFALIPDGVFVVPENWGFWPGLPKRANEIPDSTNAVWNYVRISLAGELMRVAAEVWDQDLSELAAVVEQLFADDSADSRIDVSTLSGGSEKIEGLRVARSHKLPEPL